MKPMVKLTQSVLRVISCVVLLLIGSLMAQDKREEKMKLAPLPVSAEWQKLKSLVGEWKGTFEEGGQKLQGILEVRLTADGSALMHWMDKGSPHEMITMIHPDGPKILATHYCAAHNQPRLEMTAAPGPNQIAFNFKDGTNIAPGAGHMRRLVIEFIDADHHNATWTYQEKGKDMPPSTFHYTRVK
jgi:hypothetical protein